MRSPSRPVRLSLSALLLVILVALDQISKVLARSVLAKGPDIILIPGVFRLTYVENRGAAFGTFSGAVSLLSIVTALFILWLLITAFRLAFNDELRGIRFLFLLVAAGGLGNLIDRILFGYVIDFLYFELIDFPVFNIADCCVTIGAFVLILGLFTFYRNTDLSQLSFRRKEDRHD